MARTTVATTATMSPPLARASSSEPEPLQIRPHRELERTADLVPQQFQHPRPPRRRSPPEARRQQDCGAVLLGSCCGPLACRICCCCCGCCPALKESTSTKTVYCALLVVSVGAMASMLIPYIQRSLQDIFRDFNATCIDLRVGDNCSKLTGYMAAYKVSFSFTLFFLFMSAATLGVTSSKGVRAHLHNGFWLPKVLLIVSLVVATFVAPISQLDKLHSGWIYSTLGGSCAFVLLQAVCLLDVSSSICRALEDKTTSRSRSWKALEISLAVFVVSLWLAMVAVTFVSHGGQEHCLTKHLIIVFNSGLCVFLILAALTPCARAPSSTSAFSRSGRRATADGPNSSARRPSSRTAATNKTFAGRLFQAGTVAVYVTFWTWSALQSCPKTPGVIEMSTYSLEGDELICGSSGDLEVRTESDSGKPTRLVDTLLMGASILATIVSVSFMASSRSGVKDTSCGRKGPGDAPASGLGLINLNNHRRSYSTSTTATSGSGGTSSGHQRRMLMVSHDDFGDDDDDDLDLGCRDLVYEPEDEPRFCICLQQQVSPDVDEAELGLRRSKTRQIRGKRGGDLAATSPTCSSQQVVVRDELMQTAYSYSLFHLTLALANMFVTAQLTQWFQPAGNYKSVELDRSWATVAIKIACGWSSGAIYLFHIFLPCRSGCLNRPCNSCCPPSGRGQRLQQRSGKQGPAAPRRLRGLRRPLDKNPGNWFRNPRRQPPPSLLVALPQNNGVQNWGSNGLNFPNGRPNGALSSSTRLADRPPTGVSEVGTLIACSSRAPSLPNFGFSTINHSAVRQGGGGCGSGYYSSRTILRVAAPLPPTRGTTTTTMEGRRAPLAQAEGQPDLPMVPLRQPLTYGLRSASGSSLPNCHGPMGGFTSSSYI